MKKGLDYAWHGTINWSCFKQQGVTFIMRYFSFDDDKDLTEAELNAALQNGIEVGVVWETTANRMLGGYNAGVSDAQSADARADSIGMTGIPLYFACDWDAHESDQPEINSYMDGVISVIGKKRAGMYAGYWPLKRAWDAGKLTYGWQTYAWSGGNWDSRAHLRQVQNGVTVCGVSSDWDEAHAHDYGQWPRPTDAPVTEVGSMRPGVAIWSDKDYYAWVGDNGEIMYRGPDTQNKPVCVDKTAGAIDGCDMNISPSGWTFVTFTNSSGDPYVLRRGSGGGTWERFKLG
jgi:Domain of unknown function (DUF1906)